MSDVDYTPADSPFDGQVLETAYESVKADLLALSPEELVPVNLEILAAATTAAGVIPELKALRPRIVQELPEFDVTSFDKLHQYAMAAAFTHTAHLVAARPQDHLRPIYDEASAMRELLVADATTLAKRGLIPAETMQALKGSIGFKNVHADLQMLVHVFKANWANIVGKCALTEPEIARAEKLVSWLIQAAGLKEQGPAAVAESADMRVRAFTLFIRAYGEARRAVAYLRWHAADVDTIIPSLYAGRGGRKKDDRAPTADAGSLPDVPAPTNGAGPTPVNGAASNGALPASPGGPFMS